MPSAGVILAIAAASAFWIGGKTVAAPINNHVVKPIHHHVVQPVAHLLHKPKPKGKQ